MLKRNAVRAITAAFAAAALWGGGTASAWATTNPSPSCSGEVQVSNVDLKVVGSVVVVTFDHTDTGCATTLHVHENLVLTPHAGSDPNHQLNQNFSIGPDGPNSVSVPLLAAADNKCFVQVDVHFNGQSAHKFFPTATCPSPTTTSAPPSSSPPSSTPATTTAAPPPSTTPPSTSTAPAVVPTGTTSPPQSALPPVAIETGQQMQPASRWPLWSIALAAGALLLISAGAFGLLARRRRHGSAK